MNLRERGTRRSLLFRVWVCEMPPGSMLRVALEYGAPFFESIERRKSDVFQDQEAVGSFSLQSQL